MRKSKLFTVNQSPPPIEESYRRSQKISILPIKLLNDNYETTKKNKLPIITGATSRSPQKTPKKQAPRPSHQELKPLEKRIIANKNLLHRRASSNLCLMNKENKDISLLPPLSNALTPKTNAIFQYYISEVSQQLNMGNKYSCHDEENIFIQHMLVSICTRRAHRFFQIPDEPHIKINISTFLQTEEIKKMQSGKKILLFDIDETLVHVVHEWNYQQQENKDYQQIEIDKSLTLKYHQNTKQKNSYYENSIQKQNQFLLPNSFHKKQIKIDQKIKLKIKIRAHAKQVLRRLSHDYILGIFTESEQTYAEEILKIIDPNKSLFSIKLFRQHCTDLSPVQSNSIYTYSFGQKIKDLRALSQINQTQVILIDNSPLTYLFQPENAIPIIPFFDNIEDDQMIKLEQFLHHHILKCKDVRPILKNFFQISLYQRYDTVEQVMNKIFMNTIL